MRRLAVLLAAVALGVWLASLALSARPLRPFVPRAVEFAVQIPATAVAPGPRARGVWRSRIVRAPARFDLVGLTWSGGGHVDARIRVRDASSGAWSGWVAMAADHGGSGRGAEPVWAGGADALQLRLSRRPRGLRAQFVNATGSATPAARALTALRRAAHGALAAIAGTDARAQSAAGAPAIVSREAWGAEQCGRPRADPSYGSVQAGFVHHTVNANEYGPQDSAAIVLAICRYHRNTKGWRDIGYNFLVDRFGVIFEGRAGGVEEPVIGAQAQGYNGASTGVANIGTFSAIAQTPEAVEATARLLAWKLSLHGAPVQGRVTITSGGGPTNRYAAGTPVTFERISGHRDADSTSCPGDALYAQLAEIRSRAAALAPALAPPADVGRAAVTLDAADTTLDYPQPAQLSGRAADSTGALLPGAPISIQIAGGAGFTTIARTTTRDDGMWSARLPTQYTRRLRAAARLPDGGLVASPAVAVEVAPRIGLQLPRRVTVRRVFTLRGSIRPRRAGLTLVIARTGSDGAMHTVARVPLRASAGTIRARVRLRRPALHRMRIESRGDARNGAGRSRDVYLRAIRPRR